MLEVPIISLPLRQRYKKTSSRNPLQRLRFLNADFVIVEVHCIEIRQGSRF